MRGGRSLKGHTSSPAARMQTALLSSEPQFPHLCWRDCCFFLTGCCDIWHGVLARQKCAGSGHPRHSLSSYCSPLSEEDRERGPGGRALLSGGTGALQGWRLVMQKYFREIPPFVYDDVPLGFWGSQAQSSTGKFRLKGWMAGARKGTRRDEKWTSA